MADRKGERAIRHKGRVLTSSVGYGDGSSM
jgi:hypothetical protein